MRREVVLAVLASEEPGMDLKGVFLTILLSRCCDGYRILVVFPVPARSLTILGEAVVRHLLGAGHEVTYITSIPIKESSPKLRQIDTSSVFSIFKTDDVCDLDKILNQGKDVNFNQELARHLLTVANYTAMHDGVQKLILDPEKQFDLVLIGWTFNELLVGLSSVFNCPFVWLSSMEPHGLIMSLIDEWTDPAYVADVHSKASPPFTFTERVLELWAMISDKWIRWQLISEEDVAFERAFGTAVAIRGRQLPPLEDVRYNASLVLGNSHASIGQATKLPQNYVSIAGFHIQDTPLPEDLQSIFDDAKNGVIFFSMGSLLKSKMMPESLKQGLLAMFGTLEQTVIWKLEETPDKLPNNVHVVNFAPQQSILAHPNCVLFITHGGQLSITEALHFGVPIIGVPAFGDQFQNIKRAVHKGYARQVRLSYDLPEHLGVEIREMLKNPRYSERVKELSFIYHHRRLSPGDELLHWIDHVIQTRGAPHLRSPALLLPWYQKMYVDLLCIVLMKILIAFLVLKRFVSPRKIDVNKKKS